MKILGKILPMHDAAGSHDSLPHNAAGIQILPLHDAAGSKISPPHDAAGSRYWQRVVAIGSGESLLAAGSQIKIFWETYKDLKRTIR